MCIRDSRCTAVTSILIGIWPILQRCFDPLRKMKQDVENQQKANTSNNQSPAGGQQSQSNAGNPQGDDEDGASPANGAGPTAGAAENTEGQATPEEAGMEAVISCLLYTLDVYKRQGERDAVSRDCSGAIHASDPREDAVGYGTVLD